MKQPLEKLYFEFPHAFNFPALDIKKLAKNIVTFRHNFGYIWLYFGYNFGYLWSYMVNSFIVSLDITVMINILQ